MINIKIKEQKGERKDTEQGLKITPLYSLICIFAFCSLMFNLCYAQSAKEIKKEREKIAKQGIKTRTETEYNFKKQSGKYEKEINTKKIFKYDNNGNKIEEAQYYKGKLFSKDIYKYDEKGTKIERTGYSANGKLWGKDVFKYDDNGNEVERTGYGPNGEPSDNHIYKYDDKENIIEEIYNDAYVKIEKKFTYKYDDKENMVKKVVNGLLKTKYVYEYDNNGNKTVETMYFVEESGEEIPESQTVYEYSFYEEGKEQKEKSKDTGKK